MTYSLDIIITMKRIVSIPLFLLAALFARGANAECDYSNAALYNGWGWNPVTSTSCAPADLNAGQRNCEDRGGYPWGWNPITLSSCRLDQPVVNNTGSANQIEPSTSLWGVANNRISVGQSVQASMPAGTTQHYFKLEIESPIAIEFEASPAANSPLEVSVVKTVSSDEYSVYAPGEPARCISPGNYWLRVKTTEYNNNEMLNYETRLAERSMTCRLPIADQRNNEHPNYDWYVSWYITDNGSTFSKPAFDDRWVRYDNTGEVAWRRELYNLVGRMHQLDTLADESTVVLGGDRLAKLNPLGSTEWTLDLDANDYSEEITELTIGENVIVMWNPTEIISIDPATGVELWRHSPHDTVFEVKITRNDRILMYYDAALDRGVRFFEN